MFLHQHMPLISSWEEHLCCKACLRHLQGKCLREMLPGEEALEGLL